MTGKARLAVGRRLGGGEHTPFDLARQVAETEENAIAAPIPTIFDLVWQRNRSARDYREQLGASLWAANNFGGKRRPGGEIANSEGIPRIGTVAEPLGIGDARGGSHVEVRGRGRLAVGGDQLRASQRQAIYGVDLDDVNHTAGRKAGADLIDRQSL